MCPSATSAATSSCRAVSSTSPAPASAEPVTRAASCEHGHGRHRAPGVQLVVGCGRPSARSSLVPSSASRRLSASVGWASTRSRIGRPRHREPCGSGRGAARQRDLGQHLEALGDPAPVADPVVQAQSPAEECGRPSTSAVSPRRTSAWPAGTRRPRPPSRSRSSRTARSDSRSSCSASSTPVLVEGEQGEVVAGPRGAPRRCRTARAWCARPCRARRPRLGRRAARATWPRKARATAHRRSSGAPSASRNGPSSASATSRRPSPYAVTPAASRGGCPGLGIGSFIVSGGDELAERHLGLGQDAAGVAEPRQRRRQPDDLLAVIRGAGMLEGGIQVGRGRRRAPARSRSPRWCRPWPPTPGRDA